MLITESDQWSFEGGGTWVEDFFSAVFELRDIAESLPSRAFACAQNGTAGVVLGACLTGEPDLVIYGGFGSPGVGLAAGVVVNGSAGSYLTGWSFAVSQGYGIGLTSDKTVAMTVANSNFSWGATYGLSLTGMCHDLSIVGVNFMGDMLNFLHPPGQNWLPAGMP